MRKWIKTPTLPLSLPFLPRFPRKTTPFPHRSSVGLCICFTTVLALLALASAWGDEPEGKEHATPTPPPVPPTSQQQAAAYAQVDDFQGKPRLIALNDFGPDDNDNQRHANHPPDVVVNGVAGKDVLVINAVAGQPVSLSAAGSSDPDGNQLQFQWIVYNEAGYHPLFSPAPQGTVSGANNLAATVTVNAPGTIHVILAVTDNGTPNLTSYRRVILNVTAAP